MGFVRKLTGAQGQIDSVKRQTSANIAAAKQAADAQVRALNDSARAAADAQRMTAERAKVEEAAADIASRPMEVADIALDPVVNESLATSRRRTRAQFGSGRATGVSI